MACSNINRVHRHPWGLGHGALSARLPPSLNIHDLIMLSLLHNIHPQNCADSPQGYVGTLEFESTYTFLTPWQAFRVALVVPSGANKRTLGWPKVNSSIVEFIHSLIQAKDSEKLFAPSTPHFTRAAHLPHPSPKRARLWGMHWHHIDWRLVGCTLRFTFQTV